MKEAIDRVLSATALLKRSPGYASLPQTERARLDGDMGRIEDGLRRTFGREAGRERSGDRGDPFAVPQATPDELRSMIAGGRGAPEAPPLQGAPPAVAAPRPGTEVIGDRARRTLDAVDFPSFVAGLIQGTFQAIVDATAQQVREYAKLVADLSKSIDQFAAENVSPNQARDFLAERHPEDLALTLPRPGEATTPRVRARSTNRSPQWLADYGLDGNDLTDELVEGPLLEAGRRAVAEDRMRMLANMVLLGISRIVVDDGQLKARLQFHAKATEKVSADVVMQGAGQGARIASQSGAGASQVSTMVSTVSVNAQADAAIRADLVGEVSVKFRTETFSLDRFADANAIAIIQRHARGATPSAAPAAASSAAAPASSSPPTPSAMPRSDNGGVTP